MTPRRILLAAYAVFVLYGYPGFMRADAVDELADSRTGSFTDWGSPVLTEIWRVLGRAFSGPAPLFLVTGALLLVGTYLLLRRVTSERAAAIAAACVLLAPPLLATTALVSEDSTLSAFLVFGAAMLIEPGRRRQAIGFILLTLAAAMAPGALVAVVPIVCGRKLLPGLVACIAIAALTFGLDQLLVDAPTRRPEVKLAVVDVAGTLRRLPTLDDASVQRELPGVVFVAPTDLQHHARDPKPFADPTDDAGRVALVAARRSFTRAHPGAYLRHRVAMMSRLLGIQRPKNWRAVSQEFIPASTSRGMAHEAHHSPLQRALMWPVRALRNTFLFRPFVYFFLAMVLLVVAAIRRHGLAAMLLSSGISYEIALGFVSAQPDYRDSHWMMVAMVIAAIAIGKRELEARHERILQQARAGVAHDDGG